MNPSTLSSTELNVASSSILDSLSLSSVPSTPLSVQHNQQRLGSDNNERKDSIRDDDATTTHSHSTHSEQQPKSISTVHSLNELFSLSSSDPEQSLITAFLDSKYVKQMFADEVNKWKDLKQRMNAAKESVAKLLAHQNANTVPNSMKIKIDIKLPTNCGLDSHMQSISKIIQDAQWALLEAALNARREHQSILQTKLNKLTEDATSTFQKYINDVILADKSMLPIQFPIQKVVDRYITQLKYYISAQHSIDLGKQDHERQQKRKLEEAKLIAEEMVMKNKPKTIQTIIDEQIAQKWKKMKNFGCERY